MTSIPFKGTYTALIGGLLVALLLGVTAAGAHDKVRVCHATGSEHNPYVEIEIAQQAWDNGHSRHAGDFLVTDSHPCPPGAYVGDAAPTPPTSTPTSPATAPTPPTAVASSVSQAPETRLPAAAPSTGGPPK